MNELRKNEMEKVKGGAAISVTSAINAVTKVVSTIFNIGQAIGSAIRRVRSGGICNY